MEFESKKCEIRGQEWERVNTRVVHVQDSSCPAFGMHVCRELSIPLPLTCTEKFVPSKYEGWEGIGVPVSFAVDLQLGA